MTIYDYLDKLSTLRLKAEDARERYELEAVKVTSPKSSLNVDGMPKYHSAANTREIQLIKLAEYYEKCISADRDYQDYMEYINYYVSLLTPLNSLLISYLIIRCDDADKVASLLKIKKKRIDEYLRRAISELRTVMKENDVDID